jgi:hypothetical protein
MARIFTAALVALAVSEESDLRPQWWPRSLLEWKPIPLLQNLTRHHPLGGYDVCPLPALVTVTRRPAS